MEFKWIPSALIRSICFSFGSSVLKGLDTDPENPADLADVESAPLSLVQTASHVSTVFSKEETKDWVEFHDVVTGIGGNSKIWLQGERPFGALSQLPAFMAS